MVVAEGTGAVTATCSSGRSRNYGPDPWSVAHILYDFIPGFSQEQMGGRAATPGQTQVCGCQ